MKRLNLRLFGRAYDDLQTLARRTSRSMTELARFAIGLHMY